MERICWIQGLLQEHHLTVRQVHSQGGPVRNARKSQFLTSGLAAALEELAVKPLRAPAKHQARGAEGFEDLFGEPQYLEQILRVIVGAKERGTDLVSVEGAMALRMLKAVDRSVHGGSVPEFVVSYLSGAFG